MPTYGFIVINFSRFGTPEDLRDLITTAHSMGLMVMMDVMHNQASCNQGLDMFDGSEEYFYQGRRESESFARCFDFTK